MSTKQTQTAGSLHELARLFIVVYDDGMGLCVPMIWDGECSGAICSGVAAKDRVALFTSRIGARKAITISAKWAELNKAQGRPANEDFIGKCRKNLRVVPCQPNAPGSAAGEKEAR